MFKQRNTETGVVSNFAKILCAGPSPKQRQRKKLVKLPWPRKPKQTFWIQDLMELKSMHPSDGVCTCNLRF